MILHIANRSPEAGRALEQALSALSEGDCLLLIEDGVLGSLPAMQHHFKSLNHSCYVLSDDLQSRGLLGQQADRFELVDMMGFVALTEQARKIVSWY